MSVQEVLKDAESRMKGAVEATMKDFQKIRTGRANPQILETVTVDYYGTETPVTQVATINVPEPRQLMITPYEKSLLAVIERAILASDLGVQPNNDGTNIRINFPPMTEDRRKDLVKQVASRSEEGCVAVRNVRHSAINSLREMQKNKEITEDDLKSAEKRAQDLTDKYVAETHDVQKKKETEVMEI
ncbi:MAG: ribosome recycling factor [Fimbriimonadaceae bacterium]|nr:ribosome recycling factor [Armatimonadota bacterium]